MDLKAAGVPGTMDALRVRAYLDALLGQDTIRRYKTANGGNSSGGDDASPGQDSPAQDGPGQDGPAQNSPAPDGPAQDSPAQDSPAQDSPGQDSPGQDSPAPDGPARDSRPRDHAAPGQTSGTGPDGPPPAPIRPAAKINLTIPLATLLGLADHPGEATGFGPIDATLARGLAAQAAGHPASTWCITVTDADGHPLAHGCAKPGRPKPEPPRARPPAPGRRARGSQPSDTSPPTRDGAPAGQQSGAPPGPVTPPGSGDPAPGCSPGVSSSPGIGIAALGGYRTWRLRLPGPARREPGGTGWPELTVDLEPIPVDDCDHRHRTSAHDPSDKLRHLVEIRDGTCSWPPCRRDAARCDYDHTIAFENGGLTCACNGGPRCRHHHHAKQAHGWKLEQNQPGYHTWTTPAGRRYTAGPATYPV